MAIPPGGADILVRTAPTLSATTDVPIVPTEAPPVSASNDPADQAAGTPSEMAPEAQAEARTAKQDGTRDTAPAGDQDGKGDTQAAPDAGEGAADPSKTDQDAADKNTPGWYQREITKARNRQREAEAKIAAIEEKAAKAEQRAREVEADRERMALEAAARANPANEPKPERHRFDTPEQYDEALVDWGKRVATAEAERKSAADKLEADRLAEEKRQEDQRKVAEQEIATLNAAWDAKRVAALEKYPDYTEVAERDDLNISMPMAHAIMQAENGPDIAYHLGQNPEEAQRIAAITNPGVQLLEMGRLIERLSRPAARRPSLPRPITPLNGGNAPADTTEAEPDMEQWAAKRTPEIQASRTPFISATNARGAVRH